VGPDFIPIAKALDEATVLHGLETKGPFGHPGFRYKCLAEAEEIAVHGVKVHASAWNATVFLNVRALFFVWTTTHNMTDDGWINRLREARAKDGRSLRAISMAAGVGENFLSQMLRYGKAPSIDNFIKVCRALDVSPIHILTGAPVTPEMEALLEAWAKVPSYRRKALLALITEQPAA